jgi:hypothetical protein
VALTKSTNASAPTIRTPPDAVVSLTKSSVRSDRNPSQSLVSRSLQ